MPVNEQGTNAPVSPRRLQRWPAVLAAVIGGIAAQLVGLVAAGVAGVVLVATYDLRTPEQLAAYVDTLPMLALGVLTVSGVMMLTAVAAPSLARANLVDSLGLCRAPPTVLVAAAVGTVGVGMAGDLLSSVAAWLAPELTLGTLGTFARVARSESLLLVLPLFALVPGICEELFFRGMLQRALGSSVGVVIVVAMAFSLYHIDPHQIAGTLPAGLYLGWLAARTGSTLVPIVAHVTNNCLALVAASVGALRFGYGTTEPIPGWWIVLAAAISAASIAVLVRRTRRPPATSVRA